MNKVYKDYNTKNESFIKVANKLKEEGITCYDFMLTLYDKSLSGLYISDIYNLEEDIKEKVKSECKNNIWYYFREVVKIQIPGGDKIPYELNKLTIAMIYLASLRKDIYVIGYRQSYKTHTANLIKEYFDRFHYGDIKINIVNDAEFYISGDRDPINHNVYKYYEDIKKIEEPNICIFNSVRSDDNRNHHMELIKLTTDWKDKYYDEPITNLSKFYYVSYGYKELVDDPEEFYKRMCILLNNDTDIIRREILCRWPGEVYEQETEKETC